MVAKKYGILDWVKAGWNAFRERDQYLYANSEIGPGYSYRPDRVPLRVGTERTLIASIITRIGIDGSSVQFFHARLDEESRYIGNMDSYLNDCLTTEANIDQTSRAFVQDLIESLCDEGVVAVVPDETTKNPNLTDSYDITSMRVCKILEWFPEHIRVLMYDRRDGRKKELIVPKRFAAIIQNPLYNVMNEPNSTMQRLAHKLALLDAVDEKANSSKLDLIIHLPYGAKTEVQRLTIARRRKEIENQLENNKYGIVYTDASEKITQLNRPIENHLMEQIEYLTSMLYSQLGITQGVLDGTANKETMSNYYARTIEPIVSAICEEFNRKFLSKTARSRQQKIVFFRDLFRLAPLDSIVNAGRDFTSSEIMTPNEVRQKIGLKPSSDEGADELRNRYVNASGTPEATDRSKAPENQNGTKTMTRTRTKTIGKTKVSEL